MRAEYLTLFLVVGAGVYLTRFLPLLIAMWREDATGDGAERPAEPAGWLRFVGPSIIAALLVSAVLLQPGLAPGQGGWTELVRSLLALAPTVLVAVRFENLGLTVLAGVCAYWLVSMAL